MTLPAQTGKPLHQSDELSRFVLVPLILGIQTVLFAGYFIACLLPESAYHSQFISGEALKTPAIQAFLLLNVVLISTAFKRLSWRTIDPTGAIKLYVGVVVALIAWYLATIDYNFYYDRAYYLDRAIIVALAVLVFVHPIAAPLFTILAFSFVWQLNFPLPEASWDWPDKRLLFDALVLFNAVLLAGVFSKRAPSLFIWAALCLTGSMYFHASIAKLSIGPSPLSWVANDHISNLIVSSHLQGGWLNFLSERAIVELADYARVADRPMAVVTLAIELGGVFILVSRISTRVVLSGFILLQAAIGLASGIVFWKWCAHNVALAIASGRSQRSGGLPLYGARSTVLSVVVILTAPLFFRPIHFAWFDTRMTNFFSIRVIGESGKEYDLDPRFFSPYDIRFVQSRFYYLLNAPTLVGTYGTTQSYEVMATLETASPSDVPTLKATFGLNYFDDKLKAKFASFLTQFVGNAQGMGSKFVAVNQLAPPYHFRGTKGVNPYRFQESLTRVRVYFEENLLSKGKIIALQRTVVLDALLDERLARHERRRGVGSAAR